MNTGRKNKQVRGSDDYNSSKKQKSESGPSKRRKNKTSDLNFEDDNFILDDLDTKSDDYEDLGDLVSKIGSKFEKSLFEKQKATDQLAESILKIGTDLIENVLKEQSEKRYCVIFYFYICYIAFYIFHSYALFGLFFQNILRK